MSCFIIIRHTLIFRFFPPGIYIPVFLCASLFTLSLRKVQQRIKEGEKGENITKCTAL